jgi:hypothetical protein
MINRKKIKKTFKYIILLIFVLSIFPAFIIINKVKNDYPLREYIKDNFLSEIKNDINTYLTFNTESTSNKFTELRTLNIQISDSSINHLNTQIDERINKLNKGEVTLLGTSNWDYVTAKAIFDIDTLSLKMRIRGDMPSNYNKGISEATFRINIKGEKLLIGKKKLSIIKPVMESGYYGYLFYKCFKNEGFLANQIEIIKLEINGVYVGIRFLQEGFSKELVESSSKREGPVLRFKDDCVDSEGRYNEHLFPELIAYKENKTLKTPNLSKTYARALNKYDEFIEGNINVDQCFNIEEFAKYYALCDVFLAHHSNICQNIKLYFNPVNDKFEPIAWDPSSYNRFELNLDIFKGHNQRFGEICNNQREYPIHYILAQNRKFLETYTHYLNYYTNNDILIGMIGKYSKLIEQTNPELFRQDFQNNYDIENFLKTINNIKSDFKQKQQLYGNYFIKDSILSIRSLSNLPIQIDSIKYKDTIIITNYIISPNSSLKIQLALNNIVPGSNKIKIYSSVIGTQNKSKYKAKIFYSIDNNKNTLFTETFDSSLFNIDYTAKTIKLNKKHIRIEQDLYIPNSHFTWVIIPGTTIELVNSNIICESNVSSVGTVYEPIIFKSTSQGGILIKNNNIQSILKNTKFIGLSAPLVDNWTLSGAVTFYNTKVLIDSCTFQDNDSEDALNLVSCHFKINNSILNNSLSDALDIDFGSGDINNITVNNSKNDALDFSGASININGAQLSNIGDKALSGGEQSTIISNDINIDSCLIAIASKDLSTVKVHNLKITNSTYSCVAYQKKSQFGKSKIIIKNSKNIPNNHIIEVGCTYILNNELINGTNLNVYKQLYTVIK